MDSREYFLVPTHCPVCGGDINEIGSFIFCTSKSCPNKLAGAVRVWIERLGLLNWGDALIDSLTDPDDPKIENVAGLYELSVEQIALCCSGMKYAKKCYDILHANKSIKLELVLAAQNIPNLGVSTASDIVNAGYDSIDKILSLTEEDLVKVPNIGAKTASSIYSGIQEKATVLKALQSVLKIVGPVHGGLSGLSFCITGSTSVPRKALQKSIMDNGGIVKESVVSGLSYLVTNEDPSSFSSGKMKKAQSFGTKIISESDLNKMIQSSLVYINTYLIWNKLLQKYPESYTQTRVQDFMFLRLIVMVIL